MLGFKVKKRSIKGIVQSAEERHTEHYRYADVIIRVENKDYNVPSAGSYGPIGKGTWCSERRLGTFVKGLPGAKISGILATLYFFGIPVYSWIKCDHTLCRIDDADEPIPLPPGYCPTDRADCVPL